jgi:antitoxin VapB
VTGAAATGATAATGGGMTCQAKPTSICLSHMRGGTMAEHRHVRLFRNGHNQAVRIPVEFELPGDEAIMHRDGDRLVIEPLRKRGLVALLKSMKPLEEDLPAIDDPVPAPESVF